MLRFRYMRNLISLLFVLQTANCVFAQQINPNPSPINLHLDANGNYTVVVSDVAEISGNPIYTSFYPKSFDCDNIGAQQVFVTTSMQNGRNVSFNHPSGLAIDASGNLYVSDIDGQVIRKITTAGVVTTFAGSGSKGFANGNGTAASFSSPNGLAVDGDGNVYVADMDNHAIRKIGYDGTVSTFAGSGSVGSLDGQGTAASFYGPANLAFDKNGNLIVVDEYNANIRKIDPDGLVTTLAGNGPGYVDGLGTAARFTLPYGIVIDAAGNLYITDLENYRIRKVTQQGLVTTLAGNGVRDNIDGTGTAASFGNVYGIAIDQAGNLYAYSSSVIRKITPAGIVTTLAGGFDSSLPLDGTGAQAEVSSQVATIVTDASGNMYFTDTYNNLIRMLTPAGQIITIAGNGTQASVNGTIGDLATITNRQQYIRVNIQANLAIASKPPDVTENYFGCQAVLGSYGLAISSHCADLNAQQLVRKPYTVKYVQTPAAGTLMPNNVPTLIKVVATDNWGGIDSATFMFTALNGTIDKPASISINGPTTAICYGSAVTFTATTVNPPARPTYVWTINGQLQSNDETFTTTQLKQGDKVVCVLSSIYPTCNTPITSVPFIASVIAPPVISFPNSPFIEPGASVQLKPVISAGNVIKYSWQPSTGLSDPTVQQPIASPLLTTTYTLDITLSNGCTASQSVIVRVDPDLHIPTVFTPNGDGINDTWAIKALLLYPQCTVNIFNRNGQQIYYSRGYSGWDGTYNGKKVADGTYYYIIKPTPDSPPYSGNVTIIR